MVDENVAFVRPARVYNIMKEYDLVHKWAKNEGEAKKKGFDQPEAPHEQWHTDISYIKVLGVFYYFICWNFTKRQRESVIRRATANQKDFMQR